MKRTLAMAAAVMVAAALLAPSAGAALKLKVVLKDAETDANFINDQGTSDGSFGDFEGASASSFADLVEVGFANDKKNLYVHIQTLSTGVPAAGEGFRVRVNPAAGGVYCLNFEIFFNGAQNDVTEWKAHLRDLCAGDAIVEGEVALSEFGGFMITIPRKAHPDLGKGKTLTATQAQTYLWSGSYPAGVAGPYLDTTKIGGDYKLKK